MFQLLNQLVGHSGYFEYKNYSRKFHGSEIFNETVMESNKTSHFDLSGNFFCKKSLVTAVFTSVCHWVDM